MRQCVGNCFPPNAGALGLDVSGVCESHAPTHRPRETSPRQPGAAADLVPAYAYAPKQIVAVIYLLC
jgi:hypothetical protein